MGTTRRLSLTSPSHGTPVLAQTAGRSPRSRSSTRTGARATPGGYDGGRRSSRSVPRPHLSTSKSKMRALAPGSAIKVERVCRSTSVGLARPFTPGRPRQTGACRVESFRLASSTAPTRARHRLLRVRAASSPISTTTPSQRWATSTTSSVSPGSVLDLMGSWVSHFHTGARPPHRARHERGRARGQPAGRGDRRPRPQHRSAPAVRERAPSTPPCAACRSTTSRARSRSSPTWHECSDPGAPRHHVFEPMLPHQSDPRLARVDRRRTLRDRRRLLPAFRRLGRTRHPAPIAAVPFR